MQSQIETEMDYDPISTQDEQDSDIPRYDVPIHVQVQWQGLQMDSLTLVTYEEHETLMTLLNREINIAPCGSMLVTRVRLAEVPIAANSWIVEKMLEINKK